MVAAITLYHPDNKIMEHIINMIPFFEIIYLFDNTEMQSDEVRERFHIKGIKYATKKTNKGLAYGLNVCCNQAYKDGYQWIMLLDQDSAVTLDLVNEMNAFIKEYDEERLAIVAPMIDDNKIRNVRVQRAEKKKAVITSGMVLKLEAFRKNGYFETALFLDGVDFEYCLRLYKNGYYILKNHQVALCHNQYDNERVIGQYKVNKYPAIRHYYICRSYFYIKEHYPQEREFVNGLRKSNQDWLRGVMLYDNNKFKKILAMVLAGIDYKMGKLGKCRWKMLT
ncbi:MAG: glycosyltransferase [Lachnospiraceae bacterium]|nr:glycosyltransferase [Lachnospiraceae bacterium]